jgi:tripeptidyl-peptidase-1
MMTMANTDETITLQIGLRLQNIDQLEDMLRAVSEPSSPDYGKYKGATEVSDLFKPAESAKTEVMNWLASQGITDVSDEGWHINFATTVGKVNEMLGASFAHFDVEGVNKLRTMQYSIPDYMGEHIELITPTTFFGRAKSIYPVLDEPSPLRRRQVVTNCARLVDPTCMEQMYNYGDYQADPASGSRVGFGSFLNQSARQQDLSLYLQRHSLPLTNFSSVIVNGGEDHQDPRGEIGEANLDVQFMTAAVKSLPVTQFLTGGRPYVEIGLLAIIW